MQKLNGDTHKHFYITLKKYSTTIFSTVLKPNDTFYGAHLNTKMKQQSTKLVK